MEDKKSYKESLKATALFGGVKVFTILINLVRTKVIAVLLGPEGMGIANLFQSTTNLISASTNFGIGTSAVRDIAEANAANNEQRIATVIKVFRYLVWITGLLGAGICLILAPYLSRITFGSNDYTIAFVLLSCTLLFQQLTSGQTTLLQGMRKYAYMAKSSVYGNILGLLFTVPLYFIWGFDAIVPVLILSSVISLLLSWWYSSKVKTIPVSVNYSTIKTEGTGMVKMGFFISLNGLFTLAGAYVLRIYIGNTGGIVDVGLYAAGFTLVNTYVGLIFNAMTKDYYPRLSAASNDTVKFNETINAQLTIGLLLIAPVIVAFIVYINWIIIILFSSKFIPVTGMIYWATFAVFFKITASSIAFSFLAKRDTKAFFYSEVSFILYMLLFNIIGYTFWGLTGLGISYLITYCCYLIQVWTICSKRHQVSVQLRILKFFSVQLTFVLAAILLVIFAPAKFHYTAGTLCVLLSMLFSYKELDKKIHLTQIIRSKIKRNKNN